MKTNFTALITFLIVFSLSQIVAGQSLTQSPIITVQAQEVQDSIIPVEAIESNIKTIVDEVPAEQLDFRIFKNIDVDSLVRQKSDLDQYLKEISAMEDVIKLNFKEFNKQNDFVKNEIKLVESDYKLSSQKRKMLKTDEKLMKQEKKLRDKEIKAFKAERKAFDKTSKNMNQDEKDARLLRFMDNEARIERSNNDWLRKQEVIKNNLDIISQNEEKIKRRDVDITNRYKELDRYKASLKLKQKQLSVEKKQVQLEMKKAKLDMKVANQK